MQYADGGSTTLHRPTIPTAYLTPDSGHGHGLTFRVGPATGSGPVITTVDPVPAAAVEPAPTIHGNDHDEVRSNPAPDRPKRIPTDSADGGRLPDLDPTASSATSIELPRGGPGTKATWSGTLTPPRSGRYTFSIAGTGSAALTLDGRPTVSDLLPHDAGTWSGSTVLTAGHPYRLSLRWTPVPDATSLDIPSILDLGMSYVGDAIAQAVAAARSSQVAVVFAADYSSETFDRPSLSLPGDQDALIAAVAAANPRTIVVLNTSGPVLMPWLHQVKSVLEAWYPGEQDGAAAAALLTGDVVADGSPPGHLPDQRDAHGGADDVPVAGDRTRLDLQRGPRRRLPLRPRHRHDAPLPLRLRPHVHEVLDLHGSVARTRTGYAVTVSLANTGRRTGTDVVQAYLTFPKKAGEPPAQLAAFTPVTVGPGRSRTVTLTVPATAFRSFQPAGWTTVGGTYRIGVGDSSASLPVQVSVPAP